MRRRDFITGFVVSTATPIAARAQQPTMPVIGYLSSISSQQEETLFLAGFRRGLAEFGFIEGRNVTVLYRYADGQYERLPSLAAELISRGVNVIAAGPSSPAALAAKRVTSTIPIVFRIGADPVALGLVASYNRPGGNVTGINISPESLTPKRFELLNALVPKSVPIAELINPANINVESEKRGASEAARTLGRVLLFFSATTPAEITFAFEEMERKKIGGLIIWFEVLFTSNRVQVVSLSNRYHLPMVCPSRLFTDVGALLSYGPDVPVTYRQFGAYVGKVLQGALPADLPVITPTKFDLVINLRTAKSLGLSIPGTLLATGDEVIE
jgi:putative tryptophan/tyrosine transport system substrate-binding protein